MNDKLKSLVKKAIKITPEDEFKLKLKKEIENQREKRLVDKITEDVIKNLVPLDEKTILLVEGVAEMSKNIENNRVTLKKHRIILEEVNGRLSDLKNDIKDLKDLIFTIKERKKDL